MKIRSTVVCLVAVWACVASLAVEAQTVSSRLTVVRQDARRLISEKKPDWKHSSAEPMPGSEDVIVDFWTYEGKVVKVSVIEHKSASDAEQTMGTLISESRGRRGDGLGHEGHVLDSRGDIAFRKGRLMVYVSAVAKDTNDQPALSRDFASLIATVISPAN